MSQEQIKRCPYCNEEINFYAKKCKHCGEWLVDKDSTQMEMEQKQLSKPDTVSKAVTMLWVSVGISMLSYIVTFFTNPEIGAFIILFALVGLAFIWFFIYNIGKGRNWARVTLLVLCIIGSPFIILSLPQTLKDDPFTGLLGIGSAVLTVIALVYLFQKPSSNWFLKKGFKPPTPTPSAPHPPSPKPKKATGKGFGNTGLITGFIGLILVIIAVQPLSFGLTGGLTVSYLAGIGTWLSLIAVIFGIVGLIIAIANKGSIGLCIFAVIVPIFAIIISYVAFEQAATTAIDSVEDWSEKFGEALEEAMEEGEEKDYSSTLKGIFTDERDEQTYKWVKIGNQIWMAENLNYYTSNSWCYNNNSSNCNIYGRLYTWEAAKRACPEGWHLPSDDEWTTLVNYLGGSSVAGGKLKKSGTSHWKSPNKGATNSSGFSALPGGTRFSDGSFSYLGINAYFWSATGGFSSIAWGRRLTYKDADVFRYGRGKSGGFSVRCVKDN